MFIYLYVNLRENDLCKVTENTHPLCGEIIRFKSIEYYGQLPSYSFETLRKERLILSCDSQFSTLPYKGSLENLINIALQAGDKAWFEELVYKYKYESQ